MNFVIGNKINKNKLLKQYTLEKARTMPTHKRQRMLQQRSSLVAFLAKYNIIL